MTMWRVPTEVDDWNHPGLDFWRNIYGWLPHCDPKRVAIMIDSGFDFRHIADDVKVVVCTSFEMDPRIDALAKLAIYYSDKQFVWLCDSEIYDYQLPENVTYFQYRHLHLRVQMFTNNYRGTVTSVKNKKITHKFSSLSFWPRQARALVTAMLKTYANEQSMISWHGHTKHNVDTEQALQQRITTDFDHDFHRGLIDKIRNNSMFYDLDWTWLDQTIKIDEYNLNQNFVEHNAIDIDHAAYQNCWANFNNETNNFGYYDDGRVWYTRPGPYITEKTIKPLIAGCVLLNSGQPRMYEFLMRQYGIQCLSYKLPDEHAYDFGVMDFDRFNSLMHLVKDLSTMSLTMLIDANIDVVANIQKDILSEEWQQWVTEKNQIQDIAIAQHIEKLL
jgi:hypothetical protein